MLTGLIGVVVWSIWRALAWEKAVLDYINFWVSDSYTTNGSHHLLFAASKPWIVCERIFGKDIGCKPNFGNIQLWLFLHCYIIKNNTARIWPFWVLCVKISPLSSFLFINTSTASNKQCPQAFSYMWVFLVNSLGFKIPAHAATAALWEVALWCYLQSSLKCFHIKKRKLNTTLSIVPKRRETALNSTNMIYQRHN